MRVRGFVDIAVFDTAGQRHGTPLGHGHGMARRGISVASCRPSRPRQRGSVTPTPGGSLEPGGLAADFSPVPRMGKMHVDCAKYQGDQAGRTSSLGRHAFII